MLCIISVGGMSTAGSLFIWCPMSHQNCHWLKLFKSDPNNQLIMNHVLVSIWSVDEFVFVIFKMLISYMYVIRMMQVISWCRNNWCRNMSENRNYLFSKGLIGINSRKEKEGIEREVYLLYFLRCTATFINEKTIIVNDLYIVSFWQLLLSRTAPPPPTPDYRGICDTYRHVYRYVSCFSHVYIGH